MCKIILHHSLVGACIFRKHAQNISKRPPVVPFIQEKQTVVAAAHTEFPLKLVVIPKKGFATLKNQLNFPFCGGRQTKRVKVFPPAPATYPVRAWPSKIIHVDYTRRVFFRHYFVSRKYTFDGDFQVLAPPLQVKIG